MLLTVIAVASVTLLAVLAVAGGVALVVLRPRRVERPAKQEPNTLLTDLAARTAALEVVVQGLPSLWQEERDRAKKHADRAQAAERSARALREEGAAEPFDDDGEGEGQPVLPFDALGGETGGLPPVQLGLGISRDADLQARADAALMNGY